MSKLYSAEDFIRDSNKKTPSQFKLGTVGKGFVSGGAIPVLFDGSTAETLKKYNCIGSYIPAIGDRILMAEIGGSFVVIGNVSNSAKIKPSQVTPPISISTTGTADTTYSSNEVTMINALLVDITNLKSTVSSLVIAVNTLTK